MERVYSKSKDEVKGVLFLLFVKGFNMLNYTKKKLKLSNTKAKTKFKLIKLHFIN